MSTLLLPARTQRARALRRAATPTERHLWELPRDRRLGGAKFSRQHPIGPFYADFYCHAAALVVEADGAPHFPTPPMQVARDDFLGAMGIEVLRFENRVILLEHTRVVEEIRRALQTRLPPPLPWERGPGGEAPRRREFES